MSFCCLASLTIRSLASIWFECLSCAKELHLQNIINISLVWRSLIYGNRLRLPRESFWKRSIWFVSVEWSLRFLNLVECFNFFLLRYRVFEAFQLLKLTNCRLIKLTYALLSLFTNSLLVICKEQSPELCSLKEVFSLVLRFRNRENIVAIVICWGGLPGFEL